MHEIKSCKVDQRSRGKQSAEDKKIKQKVSGREVSLVYDN